MKESCIEVAEPRLTEVDTVFIVTGRSDLVNATRLYAFTSREAASLWAKDGWMNEGDEWDWTINEVPLRRLDRGA